MCHIAGYVGTQQARLVYDMLWQFHSEDRLWWEVREEQVKDGLRTRYYVQLKK